MLKSLRSTRPPGRKGHPARRSVAVRSLVVVIVAGGVFAAAAPAAHALSSWAQATEVAAPANAGSNPSATLVAISCWSAGNCTATGHDQDSSGNTQAIAAIDTAGTWAQATEVTAPAGAGSDPYAGLVGISCSSPGNCTADGGYLDGSGNYQAMAATESSGTWAQAIEITAPANAGTDPSAYLYGISCSSAGNCTAAGDYNDSSGDGQAMVATETSGTWAQATEVTAPANAGSDPGASFSGISCSSPGNCTAAGDYNDSSGNGQAMVATETSGTWARATEVTAPANAGSDPSASFSGISCSSAGNCTAAGDYTDSSGNGQAMGATETSGTWAQATEVTAPGNDAADPYASLSGIWCSSAGNCTAAGAYFDSSGNYQAVAATESSGTWAQATGVTAPTDAASDPLAYLFGIWCSSAGNCTVVGSYFDGSGNEQAMTSTELTVTPTIDGVTFGGNPANPTVTVTGTGLGSLADLGSPTAPNGGGTGENYGNNLYFSDLTGSWQAGQGPSDAVGLIISSYSNNQITFTFGNQYPVVGPVENGDSFSLTLFGTTFNGSASLGTGYSCVVSGMSGTTSFPMVVSESPAPPASIDAGGTFQTDPAVRLTIPASVIDHFRNQGATSLTVSSQTTTLDGLSAVGGSPSGAVSPNTESASASNLPQSDTTLVADTPYSYATTYNPVVWQTGPGTGQVYFSPGGIDAVATFVISGTPTTETIACSPPSGVAALGSTTVNAPPPTPTFQVPSPTPPLQNQVSAGTDGGWATTISNTSTATVTGLTARVNVSDGGAALTYDLAGMAASGTNCATAGSGSLTCTVPNLAAGSSDTLDVLVDTTDLVARTTITGSATVSSTNAGSHATTLGAIGVVVVASGTDTKAVAAPGIPLISTKKRLKVARASVTLTLPKQKIRKPKGADRVALGSAEAGTTSESPPPVAVTLESLAPSAEPALCPPTGNLKCEGNIVQAFGNFSAYTNNKDPIVAVVKFFYGLKVPAGSVYFLKPNGKTVDKLSACKIKAGDYDTPCLAVPEKIFGSAAHDSLYAQDTVYFTGNDPAMGRR